MFFCFGRWNIADGLQDAAVVEPVHPGEGGKLNGLEGFPGAPVDEFGLVEAVDSFGQRVVVRIADAADGRLDAGLGQALGIFDRDILAAAVAVMDEFAPVPRPSVV